jgi:acyl-CoA synthetase (AMP-forming)/AMP-acid ligase II
MPNASLLPVLRDRASVPPDALAFTFTDYDRDPAGVVETLTWSALYRRTLNLAEEISQHGAVGDRALIIAPQGLPYIVAFLAAMQAGFIAVPLAAPTPGSHDERTSAVVADTAPAVVLTTATMFDVATQYVDDGAAMTAVVAVDTLDLDSADPEPADAPDGPDLAYLQYTSGSTRAPAGVMISHRNLIANFDQLMGDYLPQFGGRFPPEGALVSWLPFYHDMGLMLGVAAPILSGTQADLMSPLAFLTSPARWVQAMARHRYVVSGGPNFALDLAARRVPETDTAGLDLSGVLSIICGAERVTRRHRGPVHRTLRPQRFSARGADALIRPGRGHRVRGQRQPRPGTGGHRVRRRRTGPGPGGAQPGRHRAAALRAARRDPADPHRRHRDRSSMPGRHGRRDLDAWGERLGRLLAQTRPDRNRFRRNADRRPGR